MRLKLFAFALLASLFVSAFAQKQPSPATPEKTDTALLTVKGTYEETFNGFTNNGPANGKLTITFEFARVVKVTTNEVGNPEFSDLPGGKPASVSGSVSYQGQVKQAGGKDRYEALSSFSGALSANDVVVMNPEYNDASNGYKIRVFINPKLKGKCSMVAVRNGETSTSSDCQNGTYFFTASNPIQLDDNEDPGKTADTASLASFGVELDVEPAMGQASGGNATDVGYVWRGAVTSGSKETGFQILLDQKKEQPSDDKRSHTTRHLVFAASITPGTPR